ncbi:acetolactate synthase small subunit [Pelagibaculum spongiae]|nr:acetolactate synthase small subunit [Pelagibaculum spongiae]
MLLHSHTITAYTENAVGILARMASLFSRNRVNIEKLHVEESETKGISQFTIVVYCDSEKARKLVNQLRRIIELQDVFISRDEMIEESKENETSISAAANG